MKHTYTITGMTCDGCRKQVEKTLGNMEGITKASVNLEEAEATLEMEKHIKTDELQKALNDLGGNYNISLPNKKITPEEKIMRHNYAIHGMTCNGCRSHVEDTLQKVEGVIKASVNLEKERAEIEMVRHI